MGSRSEKVINLLRSHGPMLSGDLARLFGEEYGASNEAARQALSRAGKPVNKISAFSFEKNQKFFYLEEQYGSAEYCLGLYQAIQTSSRTSWSCLSALAAQGGCASKALLPALVSSPVKDVKGHKRFDRVIQDLLKCGLIEEFDAERWKLCDWLGEANLPRSVGIETVKKQVARDFADWAAKLNLAAYNSVKTLDDPAGAEFGKFQWAVTAPSYIQPLFDRAKNEPGFLVADVFCGRTASVDDVRFFLDKVAVLRSFRNLPAFLPVFLAERLDPNAFRLLKEKKVTIGVVENLFGRRYVQLLAEIVAIFANAGAILAKDPNRVEKLFSEISKAEGRYNDMVGDMFELLVGYYYHAIGSAYLTLHKQIQDPQTRARNELDVLVLRSGEGIVAECKATHAAIDTDFTDVWLKKNIPQTLRWLRDRYPETSRFRFQLWSLGGFTARAQAELAQAAGRTNKYQIEYFDRDKILTMARDGKVQAMVDILNQHFKPLRNGGIVL